jgi:hypothetical protein
MAAQSMAFNPVADLAAERRIFHAKSPVCPAHSIPAIPLYIQIIMDNCIYLGLTL